MSTKDKDKTVSIRFPYELYERISKEAKDERRSFNAQVLIALEEHYGMRGGGNE